MALWTSLLVGHLFFFVEQYSSERLFLQPLGSQIPMPAMSTGFEDYGILQVNPRVGDRITPIPGTLQRVKQTGGEQPSKGDISKCKKRAYRRARHRAEAVGGTWCRGQWRSARSLGIQASEVPTQSAAPPSSRSLPRLQVMTHNIGGFTQELYDTFVDWLDARCEADLVLIQETHWGLGREESRWTLKNWLVISSPDAAARFSGVAVFMRRSRFSDHQVSHVVWIPGRLIIACQ